jgi:hypothetical protein
MNEIMERVRDRPLLIEQGIVDYNSSWKFISSCLILKR